ncbi:MAG TPA: RecQ family ATP-dependent DNA helicase [Fimbriimonas sp.]|nr:RecQ family ATP-dependent DNA helicase [Fimbriimonas sp.]
MSTGDVLKRYWGFDSLRPLQQEVIDAAVANRDAVVVMPTGGGKSLCFQVPPLLDGRVTVVVSPLISLMKDQVDGLKLIGYPSAALHSNMTSKEMDEVRAAIVAGHIKLLYTSPERVLTSSMISLMKQADVARFAIDEAHCISQWGHDFRPEYRQLARLRELFPAAPLHALTATATPRVREDIAAQLQLRSAEVFVGIFDRPNLTYRVIPKHDPMRQIADAVSRHPNDASIVYCISRKDTEATAEGLSAMGIPAVAYHAGLESSVRKQVSEAFAQERVNVVVATVAFGMGIDRANVRCVIHHSMPKSIEAYQQETGRAGRDGMPSECLMLYAPNDYLRWERLILESSAPEQQAHQLAMVEEVRRYANGTKCRHAYLSEYFGQGYESNDCEACDLCLDGWKPVENSSRRGHQIIATVLALAEKSPGLSFGAQHVADILSGSRRKALLERGHHELKAYGAITEKSGDEIAAWVGQMVDQGYLARGTGRFATVCVTDAGREALRSRSEIVLRDVTMPVRRRTSDVPEGFDVMLFEALRQKRREIAVERGVPAYVIFHDSVLIAMSTVRPSTLAALSRISGVGEQRAKDLGPLFLETVKEHVAARGLTADASFVPVQAKSSKLNDTASRLRPLFRQGNSVEDARKQVGLLTNTIEGYLAEWIRDEKPDSVAAWVDAQTYDRVSKAIDEHGSLTLRPLYEALQEEVSYAAIKVVVAHYVSKARSLAG